jgi:hypothetical protein
MSQEPIIFNLRYTSTMLDHYIQKDIVYNLALTESARFTDLKPDTIENKLFDYHLKKVIAEGLVAKNEAGEYTLTPKGRRVGKDAIKKSDHLIDRAYSVLFLAICRKSDGAWLLCKRKSHPLLGKVGFMNAQPSFTEYVEVTAHYEALKKTGLDCEFTVRGSGYLRIYEKDNLESFTHFTLLECVDAQGDLLQLDELAEYYWEASPDFSAPDMLPSIAVFADRLASPGLFFLEQDFTN